MEIKQYKVEKGIATPVNPYKHMTGDGRDFTVMRDELELYHNFKLLIPDHTFACSPELSGVIEAEMFGESVWQYLHSFGEWYNTPSIRYDEFETFDMYKEDSKKGYGIETRQYLPLKSQPEKESENNAYKGSDFDTIEGAWDWHSRSIPETVYCSDELSHLLGEEIMFKRDFERAVKQLIEKLASDYQDAISLDISKDNPNRDKMLTCAKGDFEAGYNACLEANNDYAVKVINAKIDELRLRIDYSPAFDDVKIETLETIIKLLLTPNN